MKFLATLSVLLLGLAADRAPLSAQAAPMTLKAAYDAGLVMVSVEIAPTDKRGDRLQLTLEPSDKPVTVTLATTPTTLAVGKPFERLVFRAIAAQTLALVAGKPAIVTVDQLGELRFVAGKFQIAMDGAEAQYVGSATTDTVK